MLKTILALTLLLDFSPFDEHKLTQYSTLNALLAGVYDGDMTVAELKTRGDFGLGTFNGFDGEMLILDGVVYQIPAEGEASIAGDDVLVPFVTVCTFTPQKQATLAGDYDDEAVKQSIQERMFESTNVFYAIRMEGSFGQVKARSPRKQEKPYPPISEILKTEAIFEFNDVEGTMVGFWCPAYLNGINLGGWHLHFITKDRKQGGHVLSFSIEEVETSVMEMMRFEVLLPREKAFFEADLELDRHQMLHQMEAGEAHTH